MFRAITKSLKKNEKGFTLIELMVVVAIIGILAAGIIPQFVSASDKAKVSAAKADIANFRTVLEIYQAEHSKYPTQASVGAFPAGLSPYLKNLSPSDPWGGTWTYQSDNGTTYTITAGGKPAVTADPTVINGLN